MSIKDVPLDKLRLRINGQLYQITEGTTNKGDLILDIRDYTYGYNDGEFSNRIAFRCGGGDTGFHGVVEGVEIKYVKRLIPFIDQAQLC